MKQEFTRFIFATSSAGTPQTTSIRIGRRVFLHGLQMDISASSVVDQDDVDVYAFLGSVLPVDSASESLLAHMSAMFSLLTSGLTSHGESIWIPQARILEPESQVSVRALISAGVVNAGCMLHMYPL